MKHYFLLDQVNGSEYNNIFMILRIISHYFRDKFDLQGDFLVHFMDISWDEISKKPEEINVEKLQVKFYHPL